MNGINKTIRNFFGSTRAQTNGFVGLLLVIAVAIFSQPVTRWWVSSQPQDFSKDVAMLDSVTLHWKASIQDEKAEERAAVTIAYFDFDPNLATKDELTALGFSEKLTTRIINYRSKGGKFRIKADMLKLYGIDTLFYTNIAPYIQLPDHVEKPKFEKKAFADRSRPKEKPQKFNLNQADTLQLEKIYGIGPALAKRIIKYRDKLGGFVSQEQLKEVYGLDTTVVKEIVAACYLPDPPEIKKINLNEAAEKMMADHPYFGRKIASAIVAYRFQHGNFKSVDDLSKIALIDKNKLEKLSHYVTVGP